MTEHYCIGKREHVSLLVDPATVNYVLTHSLLLLLFQETGLVCTSEMNKLQQFVIPHHWCAASCEKLAYIVLKSASTCKEITEESTAKWNMLVYKNNLNLALGLSSN